MKKSVVVDFLYVCVHYVYLCLRMYLFINNRSASSNRSGAMDTVL